MVHLGKKYNKMEDYFNNARDSIYSILNFCENHSFFTGVFTFVTSAYAYSISYIESSVPSNFETIIQYINSIGGTIGMFIGLVIGVYTVLIKRLKHKQLKEKEEDEED